MADISQLTQYGVPEAVAQEIVSLIAKIKSRTKTIDDGEGGTRQQGPGLGDPDVIRLKELQQHPAYKGIPRQGGQLSDTFSTLGNVAGDLGPLVATGVLAGYGATGGFDGLLGGGSAASGAAPAVTGTGATGSGLTAADWAASGIFGAPGAAGGAASGTAATGVGGALSGLGLNPANVIPGLIQGGLGYAGAGKQADAFQNVANQNLAIGAPYRGQLEASYKPGFDLMSQPGYGDAFNRAADVATRQWGVKGNPANNPGIQGGILNDVWQGSYLPALNNYRGQLGQFGGLGLNTSGAAQLGGAQTAGGQYDALGYGLTKAFQQPSPFDEYLKAQTKRLTIGGTPYG